MIFSGVIQPAYKEIVSDMNLESEVGQRVKLSLEDYEALHENKRSYNDSILNSKQEFVIVDIESRPESKGERRYAYTN